MPGFGVLRDIEKGMARDAGQADIPHALGFALNKLSPSWREPGCGDDSAECEAHHHFGVWHDAFTCQEPASPSPDACEATSIDFLMICPSPHWYSIGFPRVVMGVQHRGERYIIASEGRRDGGETVWIGGFPGEDPARPAATEEDARAMLSAAIFMATNRFLIPPNRDFIFVSVDGADLLAEGCASSEID